jgi:hypothetical protein
MHLKSNQALIDLLGKIGKPKKATPAQIALAWLLAQSPRIVSLPGTTKLSRLDKSIGAVAVELTPDDLHDIDSAATKITVHALRIRDPGANHQQNARRKSQWQTILPSSAFCPLAQRCFEALHVGITTIRLRGQGFDNRIGKTCRNILAELSRWTGHIINRPEHVRDVCGGRLWVQPFHIISSVDYHGLAIKDFPTN